MTDHYSELRGGADRSPEGRTAPAPEKIGAGAPRSDEPSIGDLAQRLEVAKGNLEDARRVEQAARNRATDALNSYNTAAKAFDAKAEELRRAAPRDTDWAQKKFLIPVSASV